MFTIDRLAKLDAIATAVFTALREGIDWLGEKYEDFLVNATYRVTEAKERAISKAEYKIYDLEDEQAKAAESYSEAKAKLRADFERLVESLDKAQAKTEADMHTKIADAALALVAAAKDYEATVKAAFAKLDVEIIE